jgi:cell shape-determining protein MreC
MENKMKNDILKVIQENMPAQVGDVLKEQLQDLELFRGRMGDAVKEIEKYEKKVAKLEELKLEDKELKERKTGLDTREVGLDKKEREQELAMLKKELELEKVNKTEIVGLATSLFRNIDIRKHIFGTNGPHDVSQNEDTRKE